MSRAELKAKIENEQLHGLRKKDEEERCPICFCDLFDEDEMPEDAVVLMGSCTDHCYHLGCLQRQYCMQNQSDGSEFIKCAVCSHTYGVRIGD